VVYESDWKKIEEQQSELQRQLAEARRARSEIAAREARLNKQLAFLQAREAEMLRREVSSLDELDRLEAAKKAEAGRLSSIPTPPLSLLSGDFSEFLAD
jgi:chromosome segregation ATPase